VVATATCEVACSVFKDKPSEAAWLGSFEFVKTASEMACKSVATFDSEFMDRVSEVTCKPVVMARPLSPPAACTSELVNPPSSSAFAA
jgi:hypothetical protein